MTFDANSVPQVDHLSVGILGGTGDQGRGLAYRFARAGQRVIIGSRSAERGVSAAAEIAGMPGVMGEVTGAANAETSAASDIVIVAVPWEGHAELVGANAVIAVRYDATELMTGLTEVLCYGTAVVVTPAGQTS